MVRCSEEDLTNLFPDHTVSEALRVVRRWHPEACVLLTRGAAGMTLFDADREHHQEAFPVEVIDAVGAGDACMGGWVVSQLLRPNAPAAEHLAFAAATAAAACRHAGAHAPERGEVDAVLAA